MYFQRVILFFLLLSLQLLLFSQNKNSSSATIHFIPSVKIGTSNWYPALIFLNGNCIDTINKDETLQFEMQSEGDLNIGVKYASYSVPLIVNVSIKLNQQYYFVIDTRKLISKEGYDKIIAKKPFKSKIKNENSSNPLIDQAEHSFSNGSCFLIDAKGYFITNFHVVKDARLIEIKIGTDITKNYKAKIIASDISNDLSLLQLEEKMPDSIPVYISIKPDVADVGTKVYSLGYPLSDLLGEEIKLTDGIINCKSGYKGDISEYQISAAVQPGNSGSPLLDEDGNVIGVINAKIIGGDNIGYAIKSSYLLLFLSQVNNYKYENKENTIKDINLQEKIKRLKQNIFLIEIKN